MEAGERETEEHWRDLGPEPQVMADSVCDVTSRPGLPARAHRAFLVFHAGHHPSEMRFPDTARLPMFTASGEWVYFNKVPTAGSGARGAKERVQGGAAVR